MAIVSCQEEYDPDLVTYPEITVDGFSPSEGYPGSIVTITGSNFGDRFEAAKISFNGELVTDFVSYQENIMEVRVPQGATNGKLSVQVWTHVKDSIGSYAVKQLPKMDSTKAENGSNITFPGDVVTIIGSNFGIDATALVITFNGTTAEIVSIQDNEIKVIAPEGFATGYIDLTIGGSTVVGSTVMINPTASGDITPYFLANTGVVDAQGGGFGFSEDSGTGRYRILSEPWITNSAGKNKSGIGGWGREQWNGREGYICWETWGNTPVDNGIIYQPTSFALPVGSYTITLNYYSETQMDSSVYLEVAAGGNGIPNLVPIFQQHWRPLCFIMELRLVRLRQALQERQHSILLWKLRK
ncbi:IPT/TIG domain-containing protein [Thalassobellus suaedae]|uniref:DUF5013 domain-containing protein n=1 Tax=Thalassobellus suaedae TaxID=3074124 RepID=A0ABY9XXJ6_9FLAO|nr:DUF5013 domain-containing protein [Flavobacteriaceae bacterium HL-DH14]